MQILLNGLIVGSLYALIAIGFNLIYSSVRFFHIAYGALALFGAYFTYTLKNTFHINFFLSVMISGILFGVLGSLLWQFLYRPLRMKKTSNLAMIVASFGLLIIIQNTIALLYSHTTKSMSLSNKIAEGYQFGSLTITANQLIIILITIISLFLFDLLLKKTKVGSAIRAAGQNKELALIVGIKSDSIIMLSFFLGTLISVIGASLVSLEIGLRPVHGLFLILKVIIACIIGGLGSIKGAVYGGLFLGIIENNVIYF